MKQLGHIIVLSSFIVGIFFIPAPSHVTAQTAVTVELSLIPNNPSPGQTVTARVDSFNIDLSQASIVWRSDGKILSSGVGAQTASFSAPLSGKSSTISVTVRGIEGSASATQTIRPGALDVVWESPDSYTPPFYKGKALPAPGATLRVVAIPFSGAPTNTAFTWQYNNSIVQNQSGNRRNVLTISTNDLTTQNTISVGARGGAFSAEQALSIPFRTPFILAYKKNNGFVDYTQGSVKDISLSEPGTTLRFEPFHFTRLASFANSFISELSLGGSPVAGQDFFNELPISRPETGGVDTINVIIQSVQHSFQSQKQQFIVSF